MAVPVQELVMLEARTQVGSAEPQTSALHQLLPWHVAFLVLWDQETWALGHYCEEHGQGERMLYSGVHEQAAANRREEEL